MTSGLATEAITALQVFRNVILEGPPGTGKSFSVAAIADAWPRMLGLDADGRLADGSGHWAITFHPSTGYEEFVEGIRYNPKGSPKGFELLPGVFREWVREARSQPDRDFLVLIDEINRANVSAVLGDLLLGLEASKRFTHDSSCTKSDTDHADCWSGGAATQLAYSNEILGVPDNLYILGTMNSSDRSIAPLDSALRRRFAFLHVDPLVGEDLKDRLGVALPAVGAEVISRSVDALDQLNVALRFALGPDSTLGHSYLFELDPRVPGLTGYWMEVRNTTGAGGGATQVQLPKKEWVDLLLTAIAASVSADQLDNGVNVVPVEVEYLGHLYTQVKLCRPGNYRLDTLDEGGGRLPVQTLNDGVMVLSPLGVRRLRLEYTPFSGAKDSVLKSFDDRSFYTGRSTADASGRSFGAFRSTESGRGDGGERIVWRYSILPQLIDTVTQAFVPELLDSGHREAWVLSSNLPDEVQAKVREGFAEFERFLNGQLGLQIVKTGFGLTSGLSIDEYIPAALTTVDAQSGADEDTTDERAND
ncbi:McrB family protein [Microbacterium sp. SS28]|uniref:McrB family protein n=1 Tax=Microbacterium sp. SS28 TaxID=2919948 RepID=UPI001FAA6969|nr:AAA family ATPase [Microbacterium sp. SS28]